MPKAKFSNDIECDLKQAQTGLWDFCEDWKRRLGEFCPDVTVDIDYVA